MFDKQLLIAVPGLAGAVIGGITGAYEGYTVSKKEHLVYNYYNTLGGLIIGTSCGLLLGTSWFISGPMILARSKEGIPTHGFGK